MIGDKGEAWIKRADEVLARGCPFDFATCSEAIHFATSILTALYGPRSSQLQGFLSGQEAIARNEKGKGNSLFIQCGHAHGAISNAKAELQAGLIATVRVLVAGEMMAELVRLGNEILERDKEEAKNVAAVLIAAAYEDLMRRMGEEFASVVDRPKLEELVGILKTAEVLKGGEVAVAVGFLKFRNDSLHADWTKVTRAQVESCIAFLEGLILKHFSGA
jgi:hypothetical protein